MLQVCPNGPHNQQHPHVPTTVADVVASVEASIEAGASEVHVHPKDAEGRDSLDPADVDALVRALRVRCGPVPIGVTTGIWAVKDHPQRMHCVRQWTNLPDYASVNWHEPGAEELADLLLDRGIGIEAGIWHQDAADEFLRYSRARECTRILIEGTNQDVDAAIDEAQQIVDTLAPMGLPMLLHGEGSNAWPLFALAVEKGLDSRIGLEDTFILPDGRIAKNNAELIDAALSQARKKR
jgi:uncharacterized protein (DUF849 family)